MCRHTSEHAFGADILVDIGPMHSVTFANELPVCSLRGSRFR